MEKQFSTFVDHFTYPYSNCCIFVELKIGSAIIAFLITFLSFCTFVISTEATKDALEYAHRPHFYLAVLISLAVFSCFFAAASSVLFYAVLREKINLIEYWIYASMVAFAAFVLLAVAGLIEHSARHKFKFLLLLNIVFILGTLAYFILVIKSYKIMLLVELEDAEYEASLELGQENLKLSDKESSLDITSVKDDNETGELK